MSDVNVTIGGEAGQGLATVGGLMTSALVRSGYEVHVTQDYLSRIRGGHNTYSIRFGPEPVMAPREEIDVLVCLSQETFGKHRDQLSGRAVVVADESFEVEYDKVFRVPLNELASKKIYRNTVALGVLASAVCVDLGVVQKLMEETFHKKGDEVVGQNQEVLRKAYEWKEGQGELFECPAPPMASGTRLAVNGNEAIAMGAMAAGCDFCSFYPMTPSTSVPLTLIKHAKEMGIVVEQAEDEIAAANMALGAGWAGATPLVATSGGGFALMEEAVSLAGMIEQPFVLVLAQRPGPATGLPTRTEQGDLNLVLYSGHGEFPRAIFAPGDIQQCFRLTHRAFDQAEKSQGPVFVLTDQYLADSTRAIDPFDLDSLPEVAGPVLEPDNPGEYERYAWNDETGVSPRAVPGFSEALVVLDSDEHYPSGHINEDHGVRVRMMDKRLRKLDLLKKEVVPPDHHGDDDPDALLVCWGSTLGPALEAADGLRERGKSVGVLHFSQVYPLIPDQFMERLERAGEVIGVEGNHDGQFADLLHKECGFRIERRVARYDGLPFTKKYILDALA
ncbi:2-oxoacid:acceptor oxidoreductase subunit alpha [Desulfohalovibrio reitneri]|uniref:2-oxoacid:acceptor oxidoreductase subunit alpha n=1 Tax=Desulfohalovibrio reitneri TaxID=1307759 RepID=UPI0004A76385|nr:2-oxoacid:acceptor oxidoreductase subunit alpha [Desulfohalovibrio reitneri]